jgi:MarR-like DNA-binding transcriptional regulator SgrR of sgrS sRNA
VSYRELNAIFLIEDITLSHKGFLNLLALRSGPMEQPIRTKRDYMLTRLGLDARTYRCHIHTLEQKGYLKYQPGQGKRLSLFILTIPENLLQRYKIDPELEKTLGNGKVHTNHVEQFVEEPLQEEPPKVKGQWKKF